MTSPSTPGNLHALTGLRFWAALHVVCFHYAPKPSEGPWRRFIESGPNSVTLFFVLSGFVLAYSYLSEERRTERTRWTFWRARFARVYPVYLVALLVALPAFYLREVHASGAGLDAWGRLLLKAGAVLSLVHAWSPAAACVWNCPGWSLSVEAFFYLLFPFLAWRLTHASVSQLWIRTAVCFLLALCAGAVVWGGAAALESHRWTFMTFQEWILAAGYNPLLRVPQFFLGVMLGKLWLLRAQVKGSAWAALALCLLLLSMPWPGYSPFFKDALLLPAFGWMVWSLAKGRGGLAQVLSHPWSVRLGEASYALYLLHGPLHNLARVGMRAMGRGELETLQGFVGYLVLSCLVSLGVFRYVEEPARRWIRNRAVVSTSPVGSEVPRVRLRSP